VRSHWTLKALIALPLGVVLSTALADDKPLSKEDLAAKLNGIEAKDISDSPVPGVYQVSIGANVAYVTADGKYIIRGDIYDADSSANITEETRSRARVAMLESVDPKSMIVYSPKDGKVKHTVTVFTDIDCGYCRQFHREIDKVTALGIEVHYLFFPRTGPNTESWSKADHVWCASDHNGALTKAKLGGEVPSSGELVGGYLAPAQLAKVLDESATAAAAHAQ
jgi:thiol:disulfide interchange protein DsbC